MHALLPRDEGELRVFDIAFAEINRFDRFAIRRLPNQIHQLASFFHGTAVKGSDDIAAPHARFVRRRPRWLDVLEGHSAFRSLESIDAENRTIQKYWSRCAPTPRAL